MTSVLLCPSVPREEAAPPSPGFDVALGKFSFPVRLSFDDAEDNLFLVFFQGLAGLLCLTNDPVSEEVVSRDTEALSIQAEAMLLEDEEADRPQLASLCEALVHCRYLLREEIQALRDQPEADDSRTILVTTSLLQTITSFTSIVYRFFRKNRHHDKVDFSTINAVLCLLQEYASDQAEWNGNRACPFVCPS